MIVLWDAYFLFIFFIYNNILFYDISPYFADNVNNISLYQTFRIHLLYSNPLLVFLSDR